TGVARSAEATRPTRLRLASLLVIPLGNGTVPWQLSRNVGGDGAVGGINQRQFFLGFRHAPVGLLRLAAKFVSLSRSDVLGHGLANHAAAGLAFGRAQ